MLKPKHVIINNDTIIDVNSKDILASKIKKVKSDHYQVTFNNKKTKATILDRDFESKSFRILVNNNEYKVCIQDELDELIQNLDAQSTNDSDIERINAPIPGKILEILVTPGQKVCENDSLLILEAMKMENNIISPRMGVIKSVAVNLNEIVRKNQVLIEFE